MRPEAYGSSKAPALNGVWAAVDVLGGSCRAARMLGVNYMSVSIGLPIADDRALGM